MEVNHYTTTIIIEILFQKQNLPTPSLPLAESRQVDLYWLNSSHVE